MLIGLRHLTDINYRKIMCVNCITEIVSHLIYTLLWVTYNQFVQVKLLFTILLPNSGEYSPSVHTLLQALYIEITKAIYLLQPYNSQSFLFKVFIININSQLKQVRVGSRCRMERADLYSLRTVCTYLNITFLCRFALT